VVGFDRVVVEPIGVGRDLRARKEFNGLAIVDFDPDELFAGVLARNRERRLEAEEAFVESAGLGHVAHVKGGVRDADDARALRGVLGNGDREERRASNEDGDRVTEFHGEYYFVSGKFCGRPRNRLTDTLTALRRD